MNEISIISHYEQICGSMSNPTTHIMQLLFSQYGRHLPIVPGNQAHSGFRCRSELLLPTRISKSCSGWWPQHPRVVTRTTLTAYGLSKSTCHHGLASFCVSEHRLPSCSVLRSPSLAFKAVPPRTVVDWFAGFLYAMFVPVWSWIAIVYYIVVCDFTSNYLPQKGSSPIHCPVGEHEVFVLPKVS